MSAAHLQRLLNSMLVVCLTLTTSSPAHAVNEVKCVRAKNAAKAAPKNVDLVKTCRTRCAKYEKHLSECPPEVSKTPAYKRTKRPKPPGYKQCRRAFVRASRTLSSNRDKLISRLIKCRSLCKPLETHDYGLIYTNTCKGRLCDQRLLQAKDHPEDVEARRLCRADCGQISFELAAKCPPEPPPPVQPPPPPEVKEKPKVDPQPSPGTAVADSLPLESQVASEVPLGPVLTGAGGLVALGISWWAFEEARDTRDAIYQAESRSRALDLEENMNAYYIGHKVFLGVGIVALAGGLVWWLLDTEPTKGKNDAGGISLDVYQDGVGLSGRF